MDQAEIRLDKSPLLLATSLKRKREEIADSQSEDEESNSDREFDWAGDDDTLTTGVLLEEPIQD